MMGACPYFDVFSTTIINWALPEDFFLDITRRTVVGAPDALKLWDTIGENYRRVLGSG